MPKISVVLTHYNREKQLINTLKTMNESAIADKTELIIVDDASDVKITEDLIQPYIGNMLSLKLVSIDPSDKWWKNQSCITFNMGFNQCTGDIIVLGCAECLHRGDVLSHAFNNTKKGVYLTYSCYSLSKKITQKMCQDKSVDYLMKQVKSIKLLDKHWYNHPSLKPKSRHWTASIHSEDLKIIGGFDEKFADGHCYDDNDWRHKTSWYLKSSIVPPMPMVYHQWHQRDGCSPRLKKKNKKIFQQLKRERKKTSRKIR